MSEMIGLSDIEELIRLVLWSGYLENETPSSALIVADVEAGKSELVKLFAENDGVAFPHDATAWGIMKYYMRRLQNRQIRHVIFPEFVHCLSRQKETVQTLLAFLNGLIAEGVKESHTYNMNFELREPISAGIILCVTASEFAHWRKQWEGSGFLSRLLPLSYSYSLRIENEIFENLFDSGHTKHQPIMLDLPKWHKVLQLPDGMWQDSPHGQWKCMMQEQPVAVNLTPHVARELKDTAKLIGRTLNIRGFRPQLQLQKLCLARALSEGRCSVTADDVIRVQYLASQYLNLNFTEVQ